MDITRLICIFSENFRILSERAEKLQLGEQHYYRLGEYGASQEKEMLVCFKKGEGQPPLTSNVNLEQAQFIAKPEVTWEKPPPPHFIDTPLSTFNATVLSSTKSLIVFIQNLFMTIRIKLSKTNY